MQDHIGAVTMNTCALMLTWLRNYFFLINIIFLRRSLFCFQELLIQVFYLLVLDVNEYTFYYDVQNIICIQNRLPPKELLISLLHGLNFCHTNDNNKSLCKNEIFKKKKAVLVAAPSSMFSYLYVCSYEPSHRQRKQGRCDRFFCFPDSDYNLNE